VSGFVIDVSVAPVWYLDDEATEATRALLDRFENEHADVRSLSKAAARPAPSDLAND
jgi:hypothetical protein